MLQWDKEIIDQKGYTERKSHKDKKQKTEIMARLKNNKAQISFFILILFSDIYK